MVSVSKMLYFFYIVNLINLNETMHGKIEAGNDNFLRLN